MIRWSALLFGAVMVFCNGAFAQQSTGRTRSPHGPINIACGNCHTTISWSPIRPYPDFNHGKSRFAIEGRHAGVGCRQCHTSLVFSAAGDRCAECHADIHRRRMGNSCEECHTVQGWRNVARNVNDHKNRFPLFGAHAAAQCEDCHQNAGTGVFRGLSTECASCHLNDFRSAKTVDHQAAGFSTKCDTCHGTDSWIGGFDHGNRTGFTLAGAHAKLDCLQCHAGGNFTGASAACASCHSTDFNNANNPNHVTSGFSQECATCHNTNAWIPAVFNHNNTKFPLTGAHSTQQCIDCHKNGQYGGLSTTCVSCHLSDFSNTTNPSHVASGFPEDCTSCHSTMKWIPASFDHSKTQFPLTGAHASRQCLDCHKNGQYSGLSTACESCHLGDYNKTANPNHIASGFPQNCSVCHNAAAWIPSVFNHGSTIFPLTGSHSTVQCTQCHIAGVYDGTPTDCYSCHSAEYNGVTNPNHVAAAFPKNCSQCHTTSSWSGAVFNHTRFPVYSGKHAGKWTTCNDCHSNPSNYSAFTCLNCHEHEKNRMDSGHSGISNYVYNSANCYSCHPTGESD